MRTLLVFLLAFLGSAGSLQAADPFVGTWKLNVAKSNPAPTPPGMAIKKEGKEETVVIQETSERYEVQRTLKGTRENGSAIDLSQRYWFPLKGGPITYSEGPPPAAGTSGIMKKIDDSTIVLVTTRDGTVASSTHITVNANSKTMRVDTTEVDAQGQPVQGLAVFDKQ